MAGILGNISNRHSLLKSVAVKSNSCKLSAFSHSAAMTCSFCKEVCCIIKHLRFLHRCNKIFSDDPVTLAQKLTHKTWRIEYILIDECRKYQGLDHLQLTLLNWDNKSVLALNKKLKFPIHFQFIIWRPN